MPKQIITLEVDYPIVDGTGETPVPPVAWNWEDMADHYSECQGTCTYTRRIVVMSPGPVQETPADHNQLLEWHSDYCQDEDCDFCAENDQ